MNRPIGMATPTVEELEAEIERLRAALGRYASESFWQNDYAEAGGVEVPVPYTAEAFYDCGEIARETLKNDAQV